MRVDVAALLIMVLFGATGVVPAAHIFDGFASNAVISTIAVMITGPDGNVSPDSPRASVDGRRNALSLTWINVHAARCAYKLVRWPDCD